MSIDKIKKRAIPWILMILTRLITLTCRVKWHNRERLTAAVDSQSPFILAMWHNCSTIAAWALQGQAITVIVSDSKDGEYVAAYGRLFGIESIRGSSSKGAANAVKKTLALLRKGKAVAITPDGPRGPKYELQSGVLWFAASNNAPVIPFHMESTRQWVLNSWDGHRFPKPFSTIHISIGKAMTFDRLELEENMPHSIERATQGMMENTRFIQAQCRNGK